MFSWQTRTVGGALYFVTFIDDHSRKVWGFALKTKDQVLDAFKELHARLERETGRKLKAVRADNGGEYRGQFENYCKLHGIRLERTIIVPLLLLLSFGGKLLLLSFTPLIGVLLPLFRIKLLMICCLVLLLPMTYLESLDVSVWFFFMIMKETNFSLVLVCVVFLGMELVKKVIGVMIPLENVCVSWHVVFWEHKMFYQLPHVFVSLIPSIDPLPDLFPEESPTSLYESPLSITDVSSHAFDELPAPIIDVPTDTAPTVDPASPSDSHALCRSHRVTTLLSHLRDFHCFSALASLQEPQTFHEASSNLYGSKL